MKPISFEEFETMHKIEGLTYELIDGFVMMSPRPAVEHQRISGRLLVALSNFFDGKNCEPIQEIDLVLDGNNFVPDIMVVCIDELKGKRHEQPPLIVIEIVSPSSAYRDYITKRHKYAQLGIREYWLVSPEDKCIAVIDFFNNQEAHYCEQDDAASFAIPDLRISLRKVFA